MSHLYLYYIIYIYIYVPHEGLHHSWWGSSKLLSYCTASSLCGGRPHSLWGFCQAFGLLRPPLAFIYAPRSLWQGWVTALATRPAHPGNYRTESTWLGGNMSRTLASMISRFPISSPLPPGVVQKGVEYRTESKRACTTHLTQLEPARHHVAEAPVQGKKASMPARSMRLRLFTIEAWRPGVAFGVGSAVGVAASLVMHENVAPTAVASLWPGLDSMDACSAWRERCNCCLSRSAWRTSELKRHATTAGARVCRQILFCPTSTIVGG